MGTRLLLASALALVAPPAAAQVFPLDELTYLHASGASSLITFETPVPIRLPQVSTSIRFQFGFSTAESAGPGFLPDSFTITLQTVDAARTAILLTTDVHGVIAAPLSEGAVAMDPGTFQMTSVPWPAGVPQQGITVAYAVQAPVPMEFSGQSARLFLDLFDNQDALPSEAWMGNFAVVPEPSPGLVTTVLLVAFVSVRGYVKKHSHPLVLVLEHRPGIENTGRRTYTRTGARSNDQTGSSR